MDKKSVDKFGSYSLLLQRYFKSFFLLLIFLIPTINLFYSNVKLTAAMYFITCILFVLYLVISKKKLNINAVLLLMISMLIILLLPLLSSTIESFFGNYLSFILSFIIYSIFINIDGNIESKVIFFVKLSSIILCVQLLYKSLTIISSGVDGNLYKAYIQISLGNSNSLGFFLLIFFFILYNSYQKKSIVDNFILLLLLVSIVALQSRTTFIAFVLVIIFHFIEREFKKVIITLLIFIIALFSFQNIYDDAKGKVLVGYYSEVPLIESTAKSIKNETIESAEEATTVTREKSSIYKRLDDISSKRLTLYEKVFAEYKESPIIGLGLGNVFIDFMGVYGPVRSHNIILDLLATSGIIGLLVFGSILIIVMRFLWKNKNNNLYVRGVFYGFIAILIQGMLEPNIFSISVDIYLWTLIGACYVIINYQKNQSNKMKQQGLY